jgi:spoIIIJ-associated protein
MTDLKESIENIITALFKKMGVSYSSIEEKNIAGQTLYCINLDDNESGLLIGQRGDVLKAINMLVSRILEKEYNIKNKITIDINDYKKNKIDQIINTVDRQVQRVKEFKYDIELQPSNSYERMLVHAHLAGDSEIETISVGEGHDRRVVIKWDGGY